MKKKNSLNICATHLPYRYGIPVLAALLSALMPGCERVEKADAYGNFEATEITVSSEANGRLMAFNIEEGQRLRAGDTIGYVDTAQLHFQKLNLLASKASVEAKIPDVSAQIMAMQEQVKVLEIELSRIQKLLKDSAATIQQSDNIEGQIRVLQKKIQGIETKHAPIRNQAKALQARIMQVEDLIGKSIIINPTDGTVITKYAEAGELTATGKPLYRIARLSSMYLKAWVSESLLNGIAIGDEAEVRTDASHGGLKSMPGKVSWIAEKAEFTPKNIQTREDRISEVYAVKIRVDNDGSLKIGMPGEVNFRKAVK